MKTVENIRGTTTVTQVIVMVIDFHYLIKFVQTVIVLNVYVYKYPKYSGFLYIPFRKFYFAKQFSTTRISYMFLISDMYIVCRIKCRPVCIYAKYSFRIMIRELVFSLNFVCIYKCLNNTRLHVK